MSSAMQSSPMPATRTVVVAGHPVTLYARKPSGPWVSNPDELEQWEWRESQFARGEITVTFEGKPLDAAARGRDKAIRSRRAKRAHAKRRRVLG